MGLKKKKKCARCGSDSIYSYCRDCEKKVKKDYYERKKREEPDYLKKLAERERGYRLNNLEKYRERAKKKNKTVSHKKSLNAYRKRNWKRIYEQAKPAMKRSSTNQRDKLTEAYVAHSAGGKKGDFPPEFIALKRVQITAKRIFRNAKKN